MPVKPIENDYVCINCGTKTKELYKEYSSTVLKLTNCTSCTLVVDKYIEYDPVIIIIDLVLLNREAYRHVLFNTNYMFHWKLLVILQLMEAYWDLSLANRFEGNLNLNAKPVLLDRFYSGDLEYYKTLFRVGCSDGLFFILIYGLTFIKDYYLDNNGIFDSKYFKLLFNRLMQCITLSSFGIFLFLPSLIWEKFGTEEYQFLFVIIYTALSQLVAYTVLCKCSKIWSIIVILCAYAVKIKSSEICMSIIG